MKRAKKMWPHHHRTFHSIVKWTIQKRAPMIAANINRTNAFLDHLRNLNGTPPFSV